MDAKAGATQQTKKQPTNQASEQANRTNKHAKKNIFTFIFDRD